MNLLHRSGPVERRARGGTARTIARRSGTTLLWLAVVLALLAGVGAIYQALATSRGERTHPAPGALVDVGGHRLQRAANSWPKRIPTVDAVERLDAGPLTVGSRIRSATWARSSERWVAARRRSALHKLHRAMYGATVVGRNSSAAV